MAAGLLALVAAVGAAYYWLAYRRKGSEKQLASTVEDRVREQPLDEKQVKFVEGEKQVLEKLAEAGGLLSQKDLRKTLSFWSEARVSLVVNALEKQGKLKSMKQGRGNILKLIE